MDKPDFLMAYEAHKMGATLIEIIYGSHWLLTSFVVFLDRRTKSTCDDLQKQDL